jgi:serine protease AprX
MSNPRLVTSVVLGIFAFSVCRAAGAAHHPKAKISSDAAAANSSSNVSVIIQYEDDPGADKVARVQNTGGAVKGKLRSIKSLTANVPQTQLGSLAADPKVKYISLDRPIGTHDAVNITAADYSVEPINAPGVWAKGFIGTNVGVAVIDSGMHPVPDLNTAPAGSLPPNQPVPFKFTKVAGEVAPALTGRIVYSENFVASKNDAVDQFGHGTHVAGLIAGNGAQSVGDKAIRTFRGAAPNANIINLRALDDNGVGTDSSVIAAIEQAFIALKDTYNIRVINLSLGRPIYESYTRDPSARRLNRHGKQARCRSLCRGNDGRDLNLNAEGYGIHQRSRQ